MNYIKQLVKLTLFAVILGTGTFQIACGRDHTTPLLEAPSLQTETLNVTGEVGPGLMLACEDKCPLGLFASCYGEEVWCVNEDYTPISKLEACENGAQCVSDSPGCAECRCIPNVRTECHNGDVWQFDSCDELGALAHACTDGECLLDETEGAVCCFASQAIERCGDDEKVHLIDNCGRDLGVSKDCETYNSSCVETSSTEAVCECDDRWTGEACDFCPLEFASSYKCSTCDTPWTGENCEIWGGTVEVSSEFAWDGMESDVYFRGVGFDLDFASANLVGIAGVQNLYCHAPHFYSTYDYLCELEIPLGTPAQTGYFEIVSQGHIYQVPFETKSTPIQSTNLPPVALVRDQSAIWTMEHPDWNLKHWSVFYVGPENIAGNFSNSSDEHKHRLKLTPSIDYAGPSVSKFFARGEHEIDGPIFFEQTVFVQESRLLVPNPAVLEQSNVTRVTLSSQDSDLLRLEDIFIESRPEVFVVSWGTVSETEAWVDVLVTSGGEAEPFEVMARGEDFVKTAWLGINSNETTSMFPSSVTMFGAEKRRVDVCFTDPIVVEQSCSARVTYSNNTDLSVIGTEYLNDHCLSVTIQTNYSFDGDYDKLTVIPGGGNAQILEVFRLL